MFKYTLKVTRHDHSLLIAFGIIAIALFAAPPVEGDPDRYQIGRTPQPAEVERIDIDVMPDGRGLPVGQGTATQGRALYDSACGHCHGPAGRGGPHGSLAGAPLYRPKELAADKSLERTVGNYWPYATSLFDYIRRAMPFDEPGSLDSDELYAVTAYLLHLNGLIDESVVIDRDTLPGIEMPARQFFSPVGRQGSGS
jgi:cytochrome c